MGRISRAVISGSRLFNTLFSLHRAGKNITRSSGTIQSGSPPGVPGVSTSNTRVADHSSEGIVEILWNRVERS